MVILNGAGSSGKSSIARALQSMTTEPFLHVAMDTFLDMLPASHWNHRDGLLFELDAVEPGPSIAIRIGPVAASRHAPLRGGACCRAQQPHRR